jgi:NADPH2:quinone reductase
MHKVGVDLPTEHRAWAWSAGKQPLALQLEAQPLPKPSAGEVLIANRVIGMNPVDWKALGGFIAPWMPGHVPGVDGAGVVVAVGADVAADLVGQRVAYHQDLQRDGSFAEYTVVQHRALLRIPAALEFEEAAAFPCPGLTAWLALEKLPMRANGRLLINGAGGSVGHYLVQLATQRGWDVTTCSHERHWSRLADLGARHCLHHSSGDDGMPLPQGLLMHAAIDCIGPDAAMLLVPALAANGHLVCIQGRVEQWPCAPFGRALSMHEVALGALHHHGDDDDWLSLTAAGESILKTMSEGKIVGEKRVVRLFDELASVLDVLKHKDFTGKLVLKF